MKKIIIGVDMDEVLAELMDYVLEYNDYKVGNKILNREDITEYNVYNIEGVGLSFEEAIDYFKFAILSDKENYKIKKLVGAHEKLIELKGKGYVLKIVTARVEEYYGEYTRKWVDIHYPGIFEEIIFADHFHEKSRGKHEICLEEGISYMIEDSHEYAIELAKAGVKTFLLEKPWNSNKKESHENIIRIKSWDEVEI